MSQRPNQPRLQGQLTVLEGGDHLPEKEKRREQAGVGHLQEKQRPHAGQNSDGLGRIGTEVRKDVEVRSRVMKPMKLPEPPPVHETVLPVSDKRRNEIKDNRAYNDRPDAACGQFQPNPANPFGGHVEQLHGPVRHAKGDDIPATMLSVVK